MENEPLYARQALSDGARGYVLKDAAETELVTAIREAAAGESYLNPRLAARVAAVGHRVSWDVELAPRRRFFTDDPFGNRIEILAVS